MFKGKIWLNILLVVWQLPQILIGLVMLAIFHNKTTYTNPYSNITVWNINAHHAFGNACFSLGPIIVTCSDRVEEDTPKHETGHSLSSVRTGWFYFLIISIPSIFFFWYRRIKKKDMNWYYSKCWTERIAERNGMTDRYKSKIENSIK